jgi:hypothetical protein
LFLADEGHLFAFSLHLRIRRDVGHEALGADPGVDLEVGRGHDVPFFLRLRVVEERLLALFELERPLVGFLPLARAVPRFEPRFVWRVRRFEPPAVSPSPPSPDCATGLAAPSAV